MTPIERLIELEKRIDDVDAWLREGGNGDIAVLLHDLRAALTATLAHGRPQEEPGLQARLRQDIAVLDTGHASWAMQREAAQDIRDVLEAEAPLQGPDEQAEHGGCDWPDAVAERLIVVTQARDRLQTELTVTDELLADRQRVLDAIPECPAHGACVPHALAWIAQAKTALLSLVAPEPET